MLSHSPLNTAASPGPARLPIHQPQQNNSRNQMHSPSPQMQNGNYGMPPMNNNFNNQMPPGMRGGPPQQMHPDDMMGGGFVGGNYGSLGGINGLPPHLNQQNGNQMGPYSPIPNGSNNGNMNMNPHANLISPHGQPPGGMMPLYNQQGPPPGQQGTPTGPPRSGMVSPHPQSGMMSPHPAQQGGPPGMMPPYSQGPPGSGMISPHPQQVSTNGLPNHPGVPQNMMPHPQSRVMSPHQTGIGGPPPGMMPQHNNGPSPGMMGMNNIPPNMIGGPGKRMMMPQQHMHPQHMQQQLQQQQQQFSMFNQGQQIQQGGGKVYPPNQPLIYNSQNPNAPPIHPCGVCQREVQGDGDEALLCESGCNFWFHRVCINMSPDAYNLLRNEPYTEWVCDICMRGKGIPPIKLRS